MKFAASVSLAALALAGCATTTTAEAPMAPMAPQAMAEADRTPEGARAFVAAVEKDLFDLSVIGSRAGWVNALTSTTILTRWPLISALSAPKRESNMRSRRPSGRKFRVSTPTPRESSTSCAGCWCLRRQPILREPRPN